METRTALRTGEIGVDGDSRDPREPLAGEDQRPGVAFLTRDACVDQDVLQLARASPTGRPHAQAWPPKPQSDRKVGAEMSRVRIVAAVAPPYVEQLADAVLTGEVRARNNFHVVTHDTKTPTAREIDASPALATADEPQHRAQVCAREAWLQASGVGVQKFHHLNRNWFGHPSYIPTRGRSAGEQTLCT
jgi:hypothetical protein